jgi:hypothetical protein
MFDDDSGVLVLIIGLLTFFGLVIQIFFLWTLSRCLKFVRPRNRDMTPRAIWLNLIPLFNFVWIFFTINRLGSSLRKEYRSRHWPSGGASFGVNAGMAFALCAIIGPILSTMAIIGAVVCFVIYWSQIVGYSSKLQSQPYSDRPFEDFEDEFEDVFETPPRRRLPASEVHELDERIRDAGPRRDEHDDGDPDERIRPR